MENLDVAYLAADGPVRATSKVSFTLEDGEILGLVGESGSGKSTVAKAAMRVLGQPAVITGGSVRFRGREVLRMSDAELRQWRWRDVSMVMQSALNAMNPVMTVLDHVLDTLAAHGITGAAAKKRAGELLDLVEIDRHHLRSYPHELSGGMRQRVVLGIALALTPPLVFMDEPTTALDVVVERQIMRKLVALQAELGFAVLFITHDVSLLLEFATRIGVMYSGRLVEVAPTQLFRDGARHPYSKGLLGAIPRIDSDEAPVSIPGSPPSLKNPPPGCRFHPRCADALDVCETREPPLVQIGADHWAACHVLEVA
ncbi:MAG: ABC transporter ATP-binding protein [Deltaproteobacteria bacterium]|nr:ABC transporter ATP-binding protein [Deltaproteobacteria bacterium]